MQAFSLLDFCDELAVAVAIPARGQISKSRPPSVGENRLLASWKPAARNMPNGKGRCYIQVILPCRLIAKQKPIVGNCILEKLLLFTHRCGWIPHQAQRRKRGQFWNQKMLSENDIRFKSLDCARIGAPKATPTQPLDGYR